MPKTETLVKENLSTWFRKRDFYDYPRPKIIAIVFTKIARHLMWRGGYVECWIEIPRHIHIDWENLNGVAKITV